MDEHNHYNNANNGLKRIAMFSIHSDPLASLGSQESGGQNVYVRHLAEELSKLQWDVDVFTRWDSLHKKQIATVNKRLRVIRLKGGPEKFIPKSELFNVLPDIFSNFLHFINGQNSYSLVHSHYWDGAEVALMAKEKFSLPLIHNFHSLGIIRIETKKKFLKDNSEQDYFSKRLNIENKVIKEASKIILLSESEKSDLLKLYGCPPEKTLVIPGGVDLKDWPLTEKNKARDYQMIKHHEFVILFIGRFEWRKGLGTLISAVNILKGSIPHLKVMIVGGKIFGKNKNKADSKEYNRILGMVKSYKLEAMVNFTGNIENKALSNLYRSADAFVIPSYYEPFGLVALEGMANKVPVIASNVGGLASIIKPNENGLLFEPRNAKDLAGKIMQVYTSKDLSATLADNAYKKVVEHYSWKHIAKRISEEYASLMKNK